MSFLMLSDDIYEKYNIDKTRLKRDYIKNPLKIICKKSNGYIKEIPEKEDLEYMFLELCLSKDVISTILNLTSVTLGRILRRFNIKRYEMKSKEGCSELFYETYGIDKTRLSRNYISNPLQYINNYNKLEIPLKEDLEYLICEKMLFIHDVSHYFNVENSLVFKWLKHYQIITPLKEFNRAEKDEEDIIKIIGRYNIDMNRLSRDFLKYPLKITSKKVACGYEIEKPLRKDFEYLFIELNMMRKDIATFFGVSDPLVKIWNRHFKCKKSKSKIMLNAVKSKIENNTFQSSISKEEQYCFELLKEKYPDSVQQYRDDRYPYWCDMYIPSKDLFIEYQGFGGGHNNRPFLDTEEDNEELMKICENWKLNGCKIDSFENRIIQTWFIKDPMKRKTAKDNGLNWIEFFSVKEFEEWIIKI